MSDMKKVFVTLVDADGVKHRVAGWAAGDNTVWSVKDPLVILDDDAVYWFVESEGMKVEPAPEPLPTGLGAVVYLHRDGIPDMTLIQYSPGKWVPQQGGNTWYSDYILNDGGPYEILSPGVEVNL